MVTLRSYQVRALGQLAEAFRAGKRAPLIVSPTGSGKTVMMSRVVAGHVAKGGRVTWFAHRRELIQQAADTLRSFELEVGAFGEGAAAPVQILSVQGVLSRREMPPCTMACIDEAHHASADEWETVFRATKDAGALILGATATPERGDGRGLGMFDAIIVAAQIKELIAAGSLVPCDWQGPKRKVPRGKLARTPLYAHQTLANGRRNVVFAPSLKAAREWMGHFQTARIHCGLVWGAQKTEERDDVLARFRAGQLEVVFNCGVLTEGFDCPEIGMVTIARTVGSAGMLIQMAGRGARAAPGKDSYTLADLSGACLTYGLPDDDREFSLEGVGISRGSGAGASTYRLCKRCKSELPEDVCVRCGFDNGQEVPGDAGIELGRWDAKRLADDTPDKRAIQLARWMRKFPGKDAKFYGFRFKAVYGMWPSGEVLSMARRMVG